jgi:hypothetical protein
LIEYLEHVLDIIAKKPDHESQKPQKLLLCTWIVELKLNELNSILARRDNDRLTEKEKEKVNKEYGKKLKSFREFLSKSKDSKNVETIF